MHETPGDGPTQILLLRHGEKPGESGVPRGINRDGDPHRHSLIVQGWLRAGALVPFLSEPRDGRLRRPTHLYSPPAHGSEGDHGRPYETIVPLAERLDVPVNTGFVLDQEAELVADVLRQTGVVLIAWEHKRIATIANALLGDEHTAPQRWPDDRFDVIWVLDRDTESGTYRFSQIPQVLLAGDRAEPIE